ncbi:cysteine synthase family protein [Sulfitobacter sp. D35]|uniref:PLP-dependent cysteine synthase family protein n=1 Tax=Sulfitobacter sp. D35 TaxID=3083252 RepID=UPI00296FFCB9|nr:cysteine synthase family protein [Sulfitobacter sp. D35]MDW4497442.1 cysteine synthase family protein [Sulfitobacter sp. D35]
MTATVLDLIGNTPLVELRRCWSGPGRILAKAEFMQPGGSVKDRAAKAILQAARSDGRLSPGMPVVEMTSGNMGAGLAVVCAALGHPFVATMSAGNSPARARMMEGLGAEVVLVPQVDGCPGQVTGADIAAAAEAAVRIARDRGGFLVDQFNAPEGVAAHKETGREIARQAGHVDAWVASVGTGCTFIGVARALKAIDAQTLCAAIEPVGSEPLAGGDLSKPRHLLQGTGYGVAPPQWDPDLMDLGLSVTDEEAEAWKHRLGADEGLYVGYSAAANVCAAAKLLGSGRLEAGATVATVLCDTGLKY